MIFLKRSSVVGFRPEHFNILPLKDFIQGETLTDFFVSEHFVDSALVLAMR